MKKNIWMIMILFGLMVLPMVSYAVCKDSKGGEWRCFPKDDATKIPKGECKDMDCPGGCVEADNGTLGHCCPDNLKQDCRRTIYVDGCYERIRTKCLPSQYCDDNGVCQEIP